MMLRKSLVSLGALFVLPGLVAPPAVSQEESATVEAVAIDDTRPTVTFDSHEIPRFMVVEMFFRRISMVRNNARVYKEILTHIGITPGSHSAEFLDEITEIAIEALNERTVDGRLTGEAYMEHQYKAVGEKARKVGVIYRNLILGLEEAGSSVQLVERYCEEVIRPSLKVVSTDSDNTKYLNAVAEFDKQLSELQQ